MATAAEGRENESLRRSERKYKARGHGQSGDSSIYEKAELQPVKCALCQNCLHKPGSWVERERGIAYFAATCDSLLARYAGREM